MVDRRQFFERLLLRGLDRLEDVGRAISEQISAGQGGRDDSADGDGRFLRPPGALAPTAFAETCSRCGDCVRACPAQCIVIDPPVAGGLPHIVARQSPCVVCDDLSCMKACPTGALQLVEQAAQIDMGQARVDHDRCLRRPIYDDAIDSGKDAEDACRVCVVECPMGESAIGFDTAGRVEVRPGCVGCGVCERVCPTGPASVIVVPSTGKQA